MAIFDYGDKCLTKEYLTSPEYEELMETYLDDSIDRFKLDANLRTSGSFGFRHTQCVNFYVWKWLCTYQYRYLIMDLVFSDKVGIDFGGAWGPVGGNTTIVDILEGYTHIDDIKVNSLDYIFTSHTLEHVPNLDETLKKLRSKLKRDGIMIAIVPCYTCERWRAGNYNTHLWTFSLEDNGYTRIDKKIKKAGFKIKRVEYCWENSIFIECEK